MLGLAGAEEGREEGIQETAGTEVWDPLSFGAVLPPSVSPFTIFMRAFEKVPGKMCFVKNKTWILEIFPPT